MEPYVEHQYRIAIAWIRVAMTAGFVLVVGIWALCFYRSWKNRR